MKKILFILLLFLANPVFGQTFLTPQQKPMHGLQVNWAHPLSKGLVGLWLFNEGSGNKVFDLSGNGNTGTFLLTTDWNIGDSGSAVEFFPSIGSCIQIANAPTLDLTGDLTVIFRFNADTVGTDGIIGNDFTTGWWVSFHSSLKLAFWAGGTGVGNRAEGQTDIPTGEWITHAVSWQKATKTASFYRNGRPDGTDTISTDNSAGDAGGNIYIGEDSRDGLGFPTDGRMSWLMVYNRALSASEITQLYREPFCMFVEENIALMAVEIEEPPPPGGQIIMINMSAISFFVILLIFMKKKNEVL